MGTKCRFPDAVMAAENPAHCGLRLAKNPSKISTGKSSEKGRKNWENVENNNAIYQVIDYLKTKQDRKGCVSLTGSTKDCL